LPLFAGCRWIAALFTQLRTMFPHIGIGRTQAIALHRARLVNVRCAAICLLLLPLGSNAADHIFEGFTIIDHGDRCATRANPTTFLSIFLPRLLSFLSQFLPLFHAIVTPRRGLVCRRGRGSA
jgi:hypothetical protein